jgi:glycosyltransferase involved in cell wall biosynthesis
MEWPEISILIPTLNAGKVLELCLESIKIQDYPKEKIEVIIADGGSKDNTREIAQKYGALVVENPLKTAEAGKMAALKAAKGEFIVLVDSDNILPESRWLKKMLNPLSKHPEALGSEPIKYTWRKEDGFISRYCALIGINDPLVLFLGNYDRISLITNKWTEVKHWEMDYGEYLFLKFEKKDTNTLPTIGANGTIFKSGFLKQFTPGDYLFDVDILKRELYKTGLVNFIKVKTGITHTYCESDIRKFIRKQARRAQDYIYYKNNQSIRSPEGKGKNVGSINAYGLIKFILFCVTVVPLLIQSIIGYVRKPDFAWFFHPIACEITLVVYSWYIIFGRLYKKEFSRKNWEQ